MIKLIALVALAAADIDAQQDVAEGAEFEVGEELAEQLISAEMAKPANAPLSEAAGQAQAQAQAQDQNQEQAQAQEQAKSKGKQKTVKARVLMNCNYGEPDDLVVLDAEEAKQAQAAGQVDTHKEAVAYAATLPQNAKA